MLAGEKEAEKETEKGFGNVNATAMFWMRADKSLSRHMLLQASCDGRVTRCYAATTAA